MIAQCTLILEKINVFNSILGVMFNEHLDKNMMANQLLNLLIEH